MGIGRINLVFDATAQRKNINVKFDPLSKRININLPVDDLCRYEIIRIINKLCASNKVSAASVLSTEISESILIQSDICNALSIVTTSITEASVLSSSADSIGQLDFSGIVSELGLNSDVNAVVISILEVTPNSVNLQNAVLEQIELSITNLESNINLISSHPEMSAFLWAVDMDTSTILKITSSPILTALIYGVQCRFALNSKIRELLVQYRKMNTLADMKVSALRGMAMQEFFYIEI